MKLSIYTKRVPQCDGTSMPTLKVRIGRLLLGVGIHALPPLKGPSRYIFIGRPNPYGEVHMRLLGFVIGFLLRHSAD